MRIAIIGGDGRMPYAAAALRERGHEVRLSACEGTALSRAIWPRPRRWYCRTPSAAMGYT